MANPELEKSFEKTKSSRPQSSKPPKAPSKLDVLEETPVITTEEKTQVKNPEIINAKDEKKEDILSKPPSSEQIPNKDKGLEIAPSSTRQEVDKPSQTSEKLPTNRSVAASEKSAPADKSNLKCIHL